MAKRFTDSEKWDDPWYFDLEMKYKALWCYMLDRCDCAGFWKINLKMASFLIGAQFNRDEVLNVFEGRIILINNEIIFIKKFIKFQYGQLNEKCNAHIGVVRALSKYGLNINDLNNLDNQSVRVSEGLPKGSYTLMDKDKDMDIDMDMEKEISSANMHDESKDKKHLQSNQPDINICESMNRSKATQPIKKVERKKSNPKDGDNAGHYDFDYAYSLYPRKKGKAVGINILKKSIKSQSQYDNLIKAIKNYSQEIKNENKEMQYVKMFSTFARCWEDYLEVDQPVKNINEITDEDIRNGDWVFKVDPDSFFEYAISLGAIPQPLVETSEASNGI